MNKCTLDEGLLLLKNIGILPELLNYKLPLAHTRYFHIKIVIKMAKNL